MLFFWKNRDAEKATVYPLSPKSDLDSESKPLADIYRQYLSTAFEEEGIHNIAVTGGFGIGKSSMIRTFDKLYAKGKPRFLYVSLGEFQEDFNSRKPAPERGEDGREERDISEIERRLLLQIYSQFQRTDALQNSAVTVQQNAKSAVIKWITVFLSVSLFVCLAGLFRHKDAGEFLRFFHEQQYSWRLLSLTFDFLWRKKTVIHALMYLYIIVTLAAIAGVVAFRIPGFTLTNLSLKTGYMEAEVKKPEEEITLDRQSLELVCVLEQIADKIGGTVVFEDMDLLSGEVCIPIFTKLREINHMANNRMSRNRRGKTSSIRFIYVINDALASQFSRTKFFDYILPIVPTLIPTNSFFQFWKRWKEINLNLNVRVADEEERKLRKEFQPLFDCADLTHYRVQFTILNDYNILCRIWQSTHGVSSRDMQALLALAIYKMSFRKTTDKFGTGIVISSQSIIRRKRKPQFRRLKSGNCFRSFTT